MPVTTCVACVAVLFVSSDSKIALSGSTVTVFVIVPTTAGATVTIFTVVVDSGPIVPPVHVRTFAGSTAQPPANAGPAKLSRIRPGGIASRNLQMVYAVIP